MCIVGFAVADFIGPPVLWALESRVIDVLFGEMVAVQLGLLAIWAVLGGMVAAQFGLLAIWAVLGPQRWILRLPVTLTYVAFFYTMLTLGMTSAAPSGFEWYDVFLSYFLLPLVFFAVQLPLWILRMATGWRIVRTDPENELPPTGSRQFRLHDLFVATTLIAVTFGLASLGMAADELAFSTTWGPALGACLVCAAWSAFSTLPCLWAGLVAKKWRTRIVVMSVYILVMTAILLAIGRAIAGTGPPKEAFVILLSLFGTLAGVMLAVLDVVRRWGYVLRRVGPGKRAVR